MGYRPTLSREVSEAAPASIHTAAERAFAALERELESGFPPGAAAALVGPDGIAAAAWGGWAVLQPERREVTRDTVFDLASLTKQVVTVPLALRLAASGRWDLDDPVSRWLPDYPHTALTIHRCLTHTTGLPSHVPFHERARTLDDVRRAHFAVSPGAIDAVTYSDLNYMLLGWAIEACAGRPLAELAHQDVLTPLHMTTTRYQPPPEWRTRLAASEVWGHVHDENTRAMGGVSGHAGLFSTLDDMARFAAALLTPDRSPILPPGLARQMSEPQAGEPPDVRGLGWRLQPWEMIEGWPADTFGHLGFTGTSVIASPAAGVAAVLLTNATHPVRRAGGAAAIRRAFHSALADCLFSPAPPPGHPGKR